ncbi:PREDICTED: uncharacterized protein LOC104538035, partial [Mesitornis unicolor]|uniref:uncharacterized protein LOC104538035 n=1 Tax=Mesitornis unicolor TaxID=54374 RepID=UPI00052830F1
WVSSDAAYNIPKHQCLQDRLRAAQLMREGAPDCPLAVDTMDNASSAAYGAYFERLYIIQEEKVMYQGGRGPEGYKISELRTWLDQYKTRLQSPSTVTASIPVPFAQLAISPSSPQPRRAGEDALLGGGRRRRRRGGTGRPRGGKHPNRRRSRGRGHLGGRRDRPGGLCAAGLESEGTGLAGAVQASESRPKIKSNKNKRREAVLVGRVAPSRGQSQSPFPRSTPGEGEHPATAAGAAQDQAGL